MIGLGSMSGYLERLRETKTRRANRQKEFKGGNNYSNVKEKKATYNFPKMSNYTFSEFKKKLKEESQQEQKKKNYTLDFYYNYSSNNWTCNFLTLLKIE